MVILHALGECVIRTGVATITPRADLGFALASHLIAKRGKRISRQALLLLFWPAAPTAAAHALSEALHKLRRKGIPVRGDETNSVWLPPEAAAIDIEKIAGEPPKTLLDRDFTILPGYSPGGSPRFQDWFDDWRDDLQRQLLIGLRDAAQRAEDTGDSRTVMGLADQILKLDPHNQAALAATARAVASLQLQGDERRDTQDPVATFAAPNHHPPRRDDLLSTGQRVSERVGERAPERVWSLPVGGFPAARDTPILGRAAEMAAGISALESAAAGKGCSIYISGAPGVGKSRLARALSGAARERGMAVASVTSQVADVGRPLSAFVDIVPRLRNLPGAAGCSPALTPYLDRLTRHDLHESVPAMDANEVEHIHSCVERAVFDLVEAVSEEQPLLVIVENIQWLDRLSWALLGEMAAWATHRPTMFLFTSREPWATAAWGQLPDGLTHRSLLPLEEQATADHARHYALAIGKAPPPTLMQWCIAASEGNPYLLEELLNHWVTTDEQVATPRSLTALLEARLERLGPTALRVLQECAIMGKNSTLSRIERLLGRPLYELFDALEELGSAGMLTTERDEDAAGNNRALCRHDALAQAAIRKLSPSGLELLHRRAGEILESELNGSDSASLLWDCAEHWHASGNSVRAVDLGCSCISHLLEIGLAQDAAAACRKTLRFCTRQADRVRVLTTLANALHLTHSWTEVIDVVEEIRHQQFGKEPHSVPHDELELVQLDAGWHAHRDWESTLKSATRCALTETADPGHRVRAAVVAFKVATNLGRIDAMHEIYRALQSIACNTSESNVDGLMLDMIYHAVCGNASQGAVTARQLLLRIRGEKPEIRYLPTRVNCATALYRAGDFAEGEREYIDAFDRAVAIQAHSMAALISQHLVKTYVDVCAMDEAEVWIGRYMTFRRPDSELWQQRPIRLALARVELWHGNIDAADHLLENSEDPLWNDTVPSFQIAALAAKVRIELARLGDPSALEEFLARLESLSARLRSGGWQDFETFALYIGMKHIGQQQKSVALLDNYVKHERRDLSPLSAEIAAELNWIRG